jgi:hypothetical protein
VNGPDDPKWTQLGWPDNPALTASEADMEEGTLVIYYSTVFPKFAGQRHAFENRDSTLATSFAKRYEIWLAVHSLLYYQDHQGAAAEQQLQTSEAGADGAQRVQEDPDLAQERERQERCRIAILSSLFAAREVQMETPQSFAIME